MHKSTCFAFTLWDWTCILVVYNISMNIGSGEHFGTEFANDLVARTYERIIARKEQRVSSHLISPYRVRVVTHDHVVVARRPPSFFVTFEFEISIVIALDLWKARRTLMMM